MYLKKLDNTIVEFEGEGFSQVLPHKFMVTDKKVKTLKEVRVLFKATGEWVKDTWPVAKVVEILE